MSAKYLRKSIDHWYWSLRILDLLIGPKENVDCLIPFWSWSQTLLQATSMWLPLVWCNLMQTAILSGKNNSVSMAKKDNL